MLREWLSEVQTQALERLRSPLLGAFTGAWLVANWKLLLILLFSSSSIENRIAVIEQNHLQPARLIYAPLLFALVYALLMPWINLGIERIQEIANLRRRKHRLSLDTEFLTASVGRAQAQAQLNRILASDQITQSQQEEIETLKKQLAEQTESAHARLTAREAELQKLQEQYREMSHSDRAAIKRQQQEMERVTQLLEQERKQALAEREAVAAELRARQTELNLRLEKASEEPSQPASADVEAALLSKKYRLFHNPTVGPERSKIIKFEPDGHISEGSNDFENSWNVRDGKLELVQSDGKVHSRFFYLQPSGIFVHTGDSDTRSARGQYIIPERSAM